jgi:hypothetical protein
LGFKWNHANSLLLWFVRLWTYFFLYFNICHNYLPSEHHEILEIAKQWPSCRCVDFHHLESLLSRSKEALFTLRLYVPWSKLGFYYTYINKYIYICIYIY